MTEQQGPSRGNSQRRRRGRSHRPAGPSGPRPGQGNGPQENRAQGSAGAARRRPGRVLTANQVLVKYDNLLEQHLIMRRKYHDYFNRVDERQLKKLEKNFYASIEHLRRFEASLEPWQREALEKRKTERYQLDLTYSTNHELDPAAGKVEVSEEEITDPHFKESQVEAFEIYKDDTEESEGSFEDYLRIKGLA